MPKEKPKDPQRETEKIEQREITAELTESYLDYAMSVIVSRALPDLRDGLKPVQRRILWAMWDSGVTHTSKLRKSANIVGEVMGKYHPHGDSAIYDTLARMAQDFSLRYPLVEGQGNWGSIDGDAPAAMRYTEARLSKISNELLTDIEKETVDWRPNYDNSRVEPGFLPAKLPNLLLNGSVGIAVGMATSIPPHNLCEVVDATIHLTDHPDADVQELMKFVPGPDFPTGGIIYDRGAIVEAYSTGRGSVTMRAVADVEERKGSSSFQIIITEIPYQVNKADLITKIAGLVQDKKVEGIRDLRDESDREGLRIVIELKNDAAPQKILNQLYRHTDLQKNFFFNMLALTDGIQPEVFSLKDALVAYLEHRKIVIRRRTEFDLKKAQERSHILEGLVKALDAIDKVIATIKKSKDRDDAQKNLIKNFKLTEIQANAILEMRLQTLAALERQKIEEELEEKRKLIAKLQLILKSPKKIVEIIIQELKELKEKFPDARRTKVVVSGLKEFREEDLTPQEEVVVIMTQDGYIKRMPPETFRAQRRGGKGLIGFELKEEDRIHQIISANTHDNALFFTDRGRVFQTKVYEIPVASRTAKGKSVHNFLTLSQNEKVQTILSYGENAEKDENEPNFLVMTTKQGIIKKTAISDFANVRRTGIIALSLKKDDKLAWVVPSSGSDELTLVSTMGQSIRFKEKQVRAMGRTAAGIHAMRLKKEDSIVSLDVISASLKNPRLLAVMANGFGKQTPLKEFKVQGRGGSGVKAAEITKKTGAIVSAQIIDDTIEEVIAFSEKGQAIRMLLKSIRTTGRATQGVRIMDLDAGDKLISVVCL